MSESADPVMNTATALESPCADFIEPEHPLPAELQQLKQDETVCQYCGIPYLIHSEVSKMKKRVAEMNEYVKTVQVYGYWFDQQLECFN